MASPLPSAAELERATRLLAVRSRRQASSDFAGSYRAAFRGGGSEFEELRPYVPGDDLRAFDWNALARTGVPYVKRFREERDQVLQLVVDVSRSMGFGSGRRSLAEAAAHAAALLAAAAHRSGDRVGLLCFDDAVRTALAPGRGDAHLWRLLRQLAASAGEADGGTGLATALGRVPALARRGVVVVLSDFRSGELPDPTRAGRGPDAFAALARHHDPVALVLQDPLDETLPAVGAVRVRDPERPGRERVLATGSRRVRERYQAAARSRRRRLEDALRARGWDVAWLRADRDPLGALVRFFRTRGPTGRGR